MKIINKKYLLQNYNVFLQLMLIIIIKLKISLRIILVQQDIHEFHLYL